MSEGAGTHPDWLILLRILRVIFFFNPQAAFNSANGSVVEYMLYTWVNPSKHVAASISFCACADRVCFCSIGCVCIGVLLPNVYTVRFFAICDF